VEKMDLNYKEIFLNELNNIDNYIEYIEDNYYIQTENFNKEIRIDKINNLIGSFDRDNIDREIIVSIHQEVDKNILKYENKLTESIYKYGVKANHENKKPKTFNNESFKDYIEIVIWDFKNT
jgi:hypothetical protein